MTQHQHSDVLQLFALYSVKAQRHFKRRAAMLWRSFCNSYLIRLRLGASAPLVSRHDGPSDRLADGDGTTEIVYDDEEIRVVWHPGTTDYVLITFGDLITRARGHRFFADTPLKKAGVTALGFMAKRGNWYPRANMAMACAVALKKLEGHGTRITYGGSMGGYAAIKFSKVLCATQVISLCPQWSLDAAECDGANPGWQEHFCEHMRGMGIRDQDISGEVFLFADRFSKPDMFHYGMIRAAWPGVNLINVPLVGHHITVVFAGTDNLLRIILACVGKNLDALRAISRHTRRNHLVWKENIVNRVLKRSKPDGLRLLAAIARNDQRILAANKSRLLPTMDHLLQSNETHKALEFYENAWSCFDSPVRQLQTCGHLGGALGSQIVIVAAQGTRLIYDFEKNLSSHRNRSNSNFQFYIKIEPFGVFAALYAMIGEVKTYLVVDHEHNLIVPAESYCLPDPFKFEMRPAPGGRFTLWSDGWYLSADMGGRLTCNRESAKDWEYFRFAVCDLVGDPSLVPRAESKQSFFEKKDQKTFAV